MPACLTAGLIVILFFYKSFLIFSIVYLTFNSWSCIFWGKNAHCAADMEVGTRIKIRGRVQSREYKKRTDKGIEIRIAYEVAASKILVEGEEDKHGQE